MLLLIGLLWLYISFLFFCKPKDLYHSSSLYRQKALILHLIYQDTVTLITHNVMKNYGAVEVMVLPFLTSALDGDGWSASHLCWFNVGTSGIGGWSGNCGEEEILV
jgi:hypothetical protein